MRTYRGRSLALTASLSLTAAAVAQQHPFRLVNVIDLQPIFADRIGFDAAFDPAGPPPNLAQYQDPNNARVGTNPSTIATDGNRIWVGGTYEGANYVGGDLNAQRSAWYASVGVAEISDIFTISGFDNASYNRYIDTFVFGPGVTSTDGITGLDYDQAGKILWAGFDDTVDVLFGIPDPNDQPQTRIMGIDADPNSPTYGQVVAERENPFTGLETDRLESGVAVDPRANRIAAARFGSGFVRLFNRSDLSQAPALFRIFDTDQTNCVTTAHRSMDFDPNSGDFVIRVANGTHWVPRDTRPPATTDPFTPFFRFIRQPTAAAGTANTAAAGDDSQLIAVGAPAAAGAAVIGVGPNGILDTVPTPDDDYNRDTLVVSRVLQTSGGSNCSDTPGGFPFGTARGQGVAYVPSGNLVDLDEDLILSSSRANDSSGQLTQLRFVRLDGSTYDTLELPCSVPAGPAPCGVAWYDIDYHAPTGTLVVAEFEQRKVYVFRAETTGLAAPPPYDITRNGLTDMRDLAQLQVLFTGQQDLPCESYRAIPGFPARLTLNAQRLNSDSDCDLDIIDLEAFLAILDGIGGP